MRLKILWPGKTRNREIRVLQEFYLEKINRLETCELIQTKEAKGIPEKFADRIKEIKPLVWRNILEMIVLLASLIKEKKCTPLSLLVF